MQTQTGPSQGALPATGTRKVVSPLLLAMTAAAALALVFAVVGLSVGLTKGSPAADKQRVVTLQAELNDARAAHTSAVRDAHEAASVAEQYRGNFDRMLSVAEQLQRTATQIQAAGVAGNVPLVNELLAQFRSLLDQHNAITNELGLLPKP